MSVIFIVINPVYVTAFRGIARRIDKSRRKIPFKEYERFFPLIAATPISADQNCPASGHASNARLYLPGSSRSGNWPRGTLLGFTALAAQTLALTCSDVIRRQSARPALRTFMKKASADGKSAFAGRTSRRRKRTTLAKWRLSWVFASIELGYRNLESFRRIRPKQPLHPAAEPQYHCQPCKPVCTCGWQLRSAKRNIFTCGFNPRCATETPGGPGGGNLRTCGNKKPQLAPAPTNTGAWTKLCGTATAAEFHGRALNGGERVHSGGVTAIRPICPQQFSGQVTWANPGAAYQAACQPHPYALRRLFYGLAATMAIVSASPERFLRSARYRADQPLKRHAARAKIPSRIAP